MPMDIFRLALSLVDAPAVKLMGGEPTLHPEIQEIFDACHQASYQVRLFTNGLRKDVLASLNWQPQDTVTYNFYLANQSLTNQNYLWDKDISRTFHVVVNLTTDLRVLYEKLRNLADLLRRQRPEARARSGVALSLDTQEDIFVSREPLQRILYDVARRLKLWGIENLSRDHHIPVCFWTDGERRLFLDRHLQNNRTTACLSPGCASWIGIDGTVRHCNQFPIECGRITAATTRQDLKGLYLKAREAKLALLARDGQCGGCPHLEHCLGGCFKAYHLDQEVTLHRLQCS